jgi:hypothetical protein
MIGVEGREPVGGKDVPALHFGTTKMNNNFEIVDAIGQKRWPRDDSHTIRKGRRRIHSRSDKRPKAGRKRAGDRYCLGCPALESVKQGKVYYGDVPILGVPYTTGYEPIKTSPGETIGIFYVGYKK